MTHVVTAGCVDVLDRACLAVCPVDCIYEGARSMYINPQECIDCGACQPACPNEAIFYEEDVPAELTAFVGVNESFFAAPLPGRDEPLGTPRSSRKLGPVGVDHPHVAQL
ncbi:ferredoxin family protein [Pseudonocardia ailaonensis]|uniref:Ferredoxin n=1 Tax=Pseudonocardia ailaonensis TaxID=367279 RepID=A0ABN2NHW0_9PSEU